MIFATRRINLLSNRMKVYQKYCDESKEISKPKSDK